jgi:hypothetical protein
VLGQVIRRHMPPDQVRSSSDRSSGAVANEAASCEQQESGSASFLASGTDS